MRHWRFIAVVGIFFSVAVHAAQVGLIKIDGAIGPATASYISRAIEVAADQNDECLIIQLDTPGGLLRIHQGNRPDILRRKSADGGLCRPVRRDARPARAFSSRMAADVAAMAPHTTHRRGASGGNRARRRGGEDRTT